MAPLRILFLVLIVLTLSISTVWADYIGNLNSYKFHEETCYWVTRMNEENKVWIDTRLEAIDLGYVPCKICKP